MSCPYDPDCKKKYGSVPCVNCQTVIDYWKSVLKGEDDA